MSTRLLIGLYLGALVLANMLIGTVGQVALIVTAMMLVPFDFAIRVRLQELWQGPQLWARLVALLVVGGALTILTVPGSTRIATASVAAFTAGSIAGAAAYATAQVSGWLPARWTSLAVMAMTDSVVFPVLCFDEASTSLMAGQAVTKFLVSAVVIRLRVLE